MRIFEISINTMQCPICGANEDIGASWVGEVMPDGYDPDWNIGAFECGSIFAWNEDNSAVCANPCDDAEDLNTIDMPTDEELFEFVSGDAIDGN